MLWPFWPEIFENIWLPPVTYENTEQLESTQTDGDWKTYVNVIRDQSDFLRSSEEEVDEIEIFKAELNRIRMEQTYSREFQCHYDLGDYPFDTQVTKVMQSLTSGLRPHGYQPQLTSLGEFWSPVEQSRVE